MTYSTFAERKGRRSAGMAPALAEGRPVSTQPA